MTILLGGAIAFSAVSQAQGETAIGVDVGVDDNSATSVGSVKSCLSAHKDDTFQADLYLSDVEDLLAWEAYVGYDSNVVQVVDRDVQMFQAADDGSAVFNASEAVPANNDGLFRVAAADTRDPSVGDNGSGVLARLTLKAIGEGRTSLSVGPTDLDGDGQPDFGTTLTDVNGGHIGDSDGDSLFDGSVSTPEVFVDIEVPADRDCAVPGSAPAAAPVEQPANKDEGGGSSWGLLALIAAGVAALVLALIYGASRTTRRRPPEGTERQ